MTKNTKNTKNTSQPSKPVEMINSVIPLLGFCGPRSMSDGAIPQIGRVVNYAMKLRAGIVVGCASGVDRYVLAAALRIEPRRVIVYAAFGPNGENSIDGISNVAGVQRASRMGASVIWYAGGETAHNASQRLIRRTKNLVDAVNRGSVNSGMFGFVNAPPPKDFTKSLTWPSCKSGTWAALALANIKGLPVIVFPVTWRGFTVAQLPRLPDETGNKRGEWVEVLIGDKVSGGYMWMKERKEEEE